MNLIRRLPAIKSTQFENTLIHSFINSFIHSRFLVLLDSITFQMVVPVIHLSYLTCTRKWRRKPFREPFLLSIPFKKSKQ